MAAESSGTPEVKSIEENRRKRKRLTAVLDKLTSQVQVERGESCKAGPSSTQQLLSTTGDDAGDVSPKIHVGATAATATHSWSSVSESCPSGDEGSISERSPFSPSGESVSSVSDVPTAGNVGGDITDKPTVEARDVQQSKLRLDIKKSSTTTKPDVFRFDTIARETYLRRSVSEEELSADKGPTVVPPSDNQTPPIVEFLQELGVRSPRASRLSPTQCSMQATDQGTSSLAASSKETSSRTTPIVSVEEPEEVKAKVAKEEHQKSTIFELPRVLKVSKTKSLTVPSAKCHRSSVNVLSPTFPVVCSCPSCSPLISITTTAASKPTSVETHPPPLWLEAVAASEQFLAGGVPMSPVSPLTPSTPLSPVSHTFLDHYFHSKYLPDLYRRRSHSDGDLQQWTAAAGAIESAEQRLLVTSALTTAVTVSAVVTSTLTADIAGTLTSTSSSVNRSGRPIPKPLFIPSLRKGGSLESDQSTPQDSPLDLSMKFSSMSRGSSPRRRRRNRRERRSSSISSESGPGTPFLTPSSEPSPLSKGTFELSMISPRLSPLARGDGGEREKSTGGLLSVPMMKGDVTSPTLKESLAVQYNMDVSPVVEEMPPGADVAYVCPFCGQMFSLHDRLAKHMASRHKTRLQSESSSKCYLCEVCKRSFARSDMLTRHMRLHTGLKPYTCQVCGQVFSRSDHLSTHQRTHTGEKPYRCPQCPYAACRRDMITRHMRTHARYDLPEGGTGGQEMMGHDTSAAKDLTMSSTTTASAAVGVSTEEDITTESGSSGGAPATSTTLTKESSPKADE